MILMNALRKEKEIMKEKYNCYLKVKVGNLILFVKEYFPYVQLTNDVKEAYIFNDITLEKYSSLIQYLETKRNYRCYSIRELA